MRSPCVKDCPDRLPCGKCRENCQHGFQEYEKERLKDTLYVGSITAGRKTHDEKILERSKKKQASFQIILQK